MKDLVGAEAALGWCERRVEQELPELRIAISQAELAPTRSPNAPAPQAVRERLASLSNRFGGVKAINLRREPVPAAYRVFYRHIGLDPDVVHTPIEAAALQRMLDGGFLTRNLLDDVLLIGLLDTSVPVWALDTGAIEGMPGIRMSREGEAVEDGRLVVADGRGPLALLFSEPLEVYRPSAATRRLTLYALQVEGVPWLAVEEALWICRSALAGLR